MNIYQKLVEVRKAVPYLKKENSGYQFKYVSSSQTLGAIRDAMDSNGLLLVPKVLTERVLDHTTKKGEHQYFTVLNMEFTWVNVDNPEEKIVCPWVGQGLDDGEKGVGKALTYSEKFFILKFFNIATDKDDPDAHQRKNGSQTSGQEGTPKAQAPPDECKRAYALVYKSMASEQSTAAENKRTAYEKITEYVGRNIGSEADLMTLTVAECKTIREKDKKAA